MSKKPRSANELKQIIKDEDILGLKTEKRNCLPIILRFLKTKISNKRYIGKDRVEYMVLWEWVAKTFEEQKRIDEAKAVFETLYNVLTRVQIKEKKYIHKGMPLVWLCDYAHLTYQPWISKRFILLTTIEDSIASSGKIDPNKTGSYWRAVHRYGIQDSVFRKYATDAYKIFGKNSDFGKFPEWILLNLKNDIPIEYPSNKEINLYPLNRPFAKYWFDNITSEIMKKGTPFEDFCSFLLSCIPGFEVSSRFKTSDYHFDALIRNKTNAMDYRSDFGNYIISESKNWSNPISPQEVAYFASKLFFHDFKAGIIFSQKGLTGENQNKNATLTLIKSFYKIGRIIMVITESDIKEVISKKSLVDLLQSRYEESRFTII